MCACVFARQAEGQASCRRPSGHTGCIKVLSHSPVGREASGLEAQVRDAPLCKHTHRRGDRGVSEAVQARCTHKSRMRVSYYTHGVLGVRQDAWVGRSGRGL